MDHFLVLILMGFLASLTSGMLGISGGIMLMPVLIIALTNTDNPQFSPVHLAINTSLAISAINALLNAWQQSQYNRLDWNLLLLILPAALLGIFIGSLLSTYFQPKHMGIIGFFLLSSVATLVLIKRIIPDHSIQDINPGKLKLTSSLIGASASLLGIGGGSLMVPIYHYLGIELKRIINISAVFTLISTTTSLFLILLLNTVSAHSLAPLRYFIDWSALSFLFPMMILGNKMGARILHYSSQHITENLLFLLLLILGIAYWYLLP